jgi:chitodextrinase
MKGLNSHVSELRRVAGFLASFILATTGEAALYTTSGNTPYTAPSWSDVVWQPGPTNPTPGNTYEILRSSLVQNPPGDTAIFPGDALMLDRGARLRLKGTSPVTLSFPSMDGNAGLVLNGGRLQVGDDNTFTIAGQIAVETNSLIDLGWGSHDLVVTAQLSGDGNLGLFNGSPAGSMDIQSTNNPYSGDWLVISGYLKATGENSLGTGNITIGNGTLEISYDIQTPGALTLLGSNSVMVLHQDCQFSAVTINGASLEPGTYSYADFATQFPGNFAEGGSGSITITAPIPASEPLSATSVKTANVADVPAIAGSTAAIVMAVTDTTAPAAPIGVAVSVDSSTQLTLSWNPTTDSGGSGLAGYQIYRGRVLLGPTTGTSYTVSGLTAGNEYCFKIVAYDTAGNNSPASAQVCATPGGDTTVPVTPSEISLSVNSSSQITLSWNPTTDSGGSGLAGYQVYRGKVFLGTTSGTSYTASGLIAGAEYCFKIVAYDNVGNNSPASVQLCATTFTPRVAAPIAPSNLAVGGMTSASVTLNWQDNSNNETGFQIERATTATGPWSVVGLTGVNVISYTDTAVAPSTTYYYQVSAFN